MKFLYLDFELVLRRPIETTPEMGKVHYAKLHFGDYLVDQKVASLKA